MALAPEQAAIGIRRRFTTEGVHPYDLVEWERRDARITNYRDGSVAFEQTDVEFPVDWSLNATNIVAQKYFRGTLGTPEREWSLKQVADRVADTIADWGLRDGYFVDEREADAFRDELKYLIVTQRAAFNSPVWFNIGVKGVPRQASACFILSVDDTMDSILNWYREEGTIFKGGSGAGVNLSRIRSSEELLKGGGTASGPVSFMRGADASAGTIKSGGKTRRAAKMVILNVDHPDIEEFIWCKAHEERKARALEAAGFDMSLDGKDITSIQYQNANNSVRVTDEFMQAVVDDADWHLRAVITGEVIKTVRARDLMRQISQATWECADPGMQFDTTINHWHTAANTGRINGSNPCSEYVHLDNSACNLASMNLLRFLDDDGTFDVEAFKHAVEVVFSAQEILVGNADYPTDKIGETTRRFRQLGIGYANLGAKLMAVGLPYDSDGGRAWAGAITALLTGHAYATSARTAARMGPFAGYTENEEHMLRVLDQHRDEASKIDEELVPAELLSAAQRSWDEACEIAADFGVRNSQASVLAPTGCLVGGSLVATDRGLVRLRSLGDPDGEQWQEFHARVATDDGVREATKFYVNGLETVVDIETSRGYRIQGTTKHRVKVVERSGEWVWRRFADLRPDDVVPLMLDQVIGDPQQVVLPPLSEKMAWAGEHHVTAPTAMSPELAELVGYFMGDGSLHARGLRLCVTDGDFDVVDRLERLAKELFGIQALTGAAEGYVSVELNSVRLAEWWQACGFAKRRPQDGHRGKGYHPHIPDAVLHSNDRETYGAFVRGLFEADDTATGGCPSWTTTSDEFSHDVQSLLLALGFVTTRRYGVSGRGSRLAILRLLNRSMNQRWLDDIGFVSDRKNAGLHTADAQQSARHDHIPVTRELIDRVLPDNDRDRKVALMEFNRNGGITRRLAREVAERTGDSELTHLLGYFFDRITTAELADEELTYDISVPDNVTYTANGFVSHNTIGLMMDCDTTGVEPDLGLVKLKKLVGGGTMSIVNQTIPRALRNLEYTESEIDQIVAYIDEHKTIVGAPHLKQEHLPVFACSMGDNVIHYLGHVKMMGAVQPFISGAISKCVTGEALLPTEDGLIRIESLHRGEAPDTFRDETLRIASLGGEQKTDAFYFGGDRAVRRAVLRSGHRVTGTPNHRLLVAGDTGLDWRRLDELGVGDMVAVKYGADLWSTLPARFDDFDPSARYGSQKTVRIPTEMSDDLAYLLGAFAAEGHISQSTWTINITNSVPEVRRHLIALWSALFDVRAVESQSGDRCPQVIVSSKTIVEFFDHLGVGHRAAEKRIPDAVLRSPRSAVLAFLQGLSLDAYVSVTHAPKWGICLDASELLDDLQSVLTNLGIVHGRIRKYNSEYDKYYDEVYVTGPDAQELCALVPFIEPDKADRADELSRRTFEVNRNTADVVPGISPRELYEMLPRGERNLSGELVRSEFAFLCDPRTRRVSRNTLERVWWVPAVQLPEWLHRIVLDRLHFSPVESIADAGVQPVFDVSVPATHAFVGNGIVNHNTVNMPEDVSVEDVEQLHIDAWKLGIKAVAIYRDNCKVAQPLAMAKKEGDSTDASAQATQVVEKIVEKVIREPVRQKLPRTRSSRTFEFRVADCKGFVTVGEYEDGRPGEIFVRVSKQGSTLAGIMDAFAISVSHGLQYGVPLRSFVEAFTGMRFEPAGMTDDEDIRIANSLMDYLFRKLAVLYLSHEERAELNILTTQERLQPTLPGVEETVVETRQGSELPADPPSVESASTLFDQQPAASAPVRHADAPMCMQCGVQMQRAGSCHACPSCGTTSGCS
jgi:ribonucleoside-diphosphate reductase alpha chain